MKKVTHTIDNKLTGAGCEDYMKTNVRMKTTRTTAGSCDQVGVHSRVL